MRSLLVPALLAAVLCGAGLEAQSCGAGQNLLKNDAIPGVPNGATAVALVPGLCDGEAAMSVFRTQGAVRIDKASVMFANNFGASGTLALVNLEIYSGATFRTDGRVSLGPKVFDFASATGNDIQISTHALNEIDISSRNVVISTGTVVIAWRMQLNTASGSCALGYTSNFATDNNFVCRSGENILDAQGVGPVDPCTYLGFGVPLYPTFFRGNWLIRACATPQISAEWTGQPTPGGFLSFTFRAPGQAGNGYTAFVGGSATTGFLTPWGQLPLDPDPIFVCFLGACRGLTFNFQGVLNANSLGFGGMLIPADPLLVGSNLRLLASFVTHPPASFTPWIGISPPSQPIVIN
ncbi:MAG: hypothetical protein IPN34_03750 [Planctomycetes bacterium]|nr:hypothetical protein [Planctomycetota bacterium]